MNKRRVEAIGWQVLAMAVMLSAGLPTHAQDRTTSYRSMAPVEQYLMPDHNAEIAVLEVRLRRPSRAVPRCWFWADMDTPPQSKGTTALCARSNGAGCLPSMHRSSGIRRCGVRSVQSGRCALDFAIDAEKEVGAGAERTFKRSSDGRHPSCAEGQGTSNVRTRRDELHDVEARVPGRWRRPLGFASDVLCPADETFELGRGFAGISGYC